MRLFTRILDRVPELFSRERVLALCLVTTLAIAVADNFYTPRMSFTLWYVAPSALMGAVAGFRAGLLCALISGLLMALTEWYSTLNSPQPFVLAWNTVTRMLFYSAAAWVTAYATDLNKKLKEINLAERNRAARELEQSEIRNSELLANIPAVTWSSSEDGSTSYVHPNAERILGYPASYFAPNVQERWLSILAPEDREHARKSFKELFSSGSFDLEYRLRVPDGRTRWMHAKSVTLFEKDGSKHAYGITLDITQQKQAQFILQLQRDLGRTLSTTTDLDAALQAILEVATRLEGLDCGGVYLVLEDGGIRMAAHKGISPEFAEEVSQYPAGSSRAQIVQRGLPVYIPFDHMSSPGGAANAEKITMLAVVPLKHEGIVIGSLNVASKSQGSISAENRFILECIAAQGAGALARIRAERALHSTEARLRSIVNGAPLIIFATDAQCRLSLMDGRALEALDVVKVAGTSAEKAFQQYPALIGNIRRALSGEEFNSVVELGTRVFDCWHSPDRDASGAVIGMICVATDITERHRLERQLLEISDREQARIGQDIHDGLCQELVGIAFDANSLNHTLKATQHPEAATAGRIAELLDGTITRARQISRGLFPIKLDADSLPSALEELCANVSQRFKIQCLFEAEKPQLPAGRHIATHLFRVAQEAVANAIKHSGASVIRVCLHSSAHHVFLDILDNGTGLQTAALSNGIGLHIMRYRARTIGGHLRIGRPGTESGALISCCVPLKKR